MLKEALKKKSEGLELTDEEKILVSQYEELLQESNSALSVLQQEKDLNVKKFETANEELQQKLKELTEISNELTSVKSENESLVKLLNDAETSAKLKEELAKLEAEKKAKLEQEKKEKESKETISRYESNLKSLQEEMEKIKSQNEIMNFKYEISKKKSEFPYLEKELQLILDNLESKGLENSRIILNFLISSKNHDEEMRKYEAEKNAGTNIFGGKTPEIKPKQKEVDPKYAKFGDLNLDLMKQYGFISK